MKKTTVCRTLVMPDMMRIARYEKAPEFGPKVLFFSGGSALNETSRELKKFTHNSIHLVTPFDSGGSSAVLREAFDMPAIGDMRSRMMALADETISGHPEVFQLFAYRLPKDMRQKELVQKLKEMVEGKDPLVAAIKNPMRKLIRHHLEMFVANMREDFNLKGASIGNLILSAGYLDHDHKLDPVIFMFSKLVNVLGHVSPIVHDPLHLAAKLQDGRTVIGQHMLTGKEVGPLDSPIDEFYLVKSLKNPVKTNAVLQKKKRKLIEEAELICYPPGSFYSSILANLLPKGVGQAIAKQVCPKVYVPSLGVDPERLGLGLDQSIFKLIEVLKRDCGEGCEPNKLVDFVLVDSENGQKLKQSTTRELRKLGINVIDTRLISPITAPYYDPQLLVMALLSLT